MTVRAHAPRRPHSPPNPDHTLIFQYILRVDKRQKQVILISSLLSHFLCAHSRILHQLEALAQKARPGYFHLFWTISLGKLLKGKVALPFEQEEACYHCR